MKGSWQGTYERRRWQRAVGELRRANTGANHAPLSARSGQLVQDCYPLSFPVDAIRGDCYDLQYAITLMVMVVMTNRRIATTFQCPLTGHILRSIELHAGITCPNIKIFLCKEEQCIRDCIAGGIAGFHCSGEMLISRMTKASMHYFVLDPIYIHTYIHTYIYIYIYSTGF